MLLASEEDARLCLLLFLRLLAPRRRGFSLEALLEEVASLTLLLPWRWLSPAKKKIKLMSPFQR